MTGTNEGAVAHAQEVRAGERFEFGSNWRRFLKTLNDDRIKLAKDSLVEYLQVDNLLGKTFIDVGSGSGLFSLCARLLGAEVFSFDYDPNSVYCTRELKRRYFPDDPKWTVESGSVLDKDYLAKLGQFDVVYSWGVLHHTGHMWDALNNVKPLAKVGGKLYIAIYNDMGGPTDYWAAVKKKYNAMPRPLAFAYACGIVAREEYNALRSHMRSHTVDDWWRTWSEYEKVSMRGMSRWHDWIDWIGGHPYERATIEQIVDVYADDGFQLVKTYDCSSGYGCNQFVFNRISGAGTFAPPLIDGGVSAARRFGVRIAGPIERRADGWYGTPSVKLAPDATYTLLHHDAVAARDERVQDGMIRFAAPALDEANARATRCYAVRGEFSKLDSPFAHIRGNMFEKTIGHDDIADCSGQEHRSPFFVFENGKQLPYPHSIHDIIDKSGGGRFSHWGGSILFSSPDNTNPNENGRSYELFRAAPSSA